MKTRIFLQSAICILAAASVSCTKEENGIEPEKRYESFVVSAVSEDATKTQLTNGNTVIWLAGDDVSAFSVNASSHKNNRLSCTSASGTSATFSGEIEDGTTSFLLVYPYNANMSYNGTTISNAVIPETQTATAGSFANGASLGLATGTKTPGKPECSAGNFKNLCAVLSFTLPQGLDFANEIIVSSKTNVGMAGTVTIDGANQVITSATATSVKLTGSFTGGSTYYVAVAPGRHTTGFSFTIKTNGGNTYSRETTKDITAAAGTIYHLGSLSPIMASEDFSTSVSISHDVESGTLTGSTARFTLTNNKSEFAGVIKKYKAEVSLKNNTGSLVRTLNFEKEKIDGVEMVDQEETYFYLPKGDYTYEAKITYTVHNGSKYVERVLQYSGSATSPQPSGINLSTNFTGYTSYSAYKGTDGQSKSVSNANGMDNSTVYNVGASYGGGLSDNVYSQCSSLLSFSWTYDGNTTSAGNKTGQSWEAHTIAATISFDGFSVNSSKTVYVTGLPYIVPNNKMANVSSQWSYSTSAHSVLKDNFVELGVAGGKCKMYKSFYIPSNIDVSTNYKIYAISGTVKGTTTFVVGDSQIFQATPKSYKETQYSNVTSNSSFSSSNQEVSVEQSYGYGATRTEIYWINIYYR